MYLLPGCLQGGVPVTDALGLGDGAPLLGHERARHPRLVPVRRLSRVRHLDLRFGPGGGLWGPSVGDAHGTPENYAYPLSVARVPFRAEPSSKLRLRGQMLQGHLPSSYTTELT